MVYLLPRIEYSVTTLSVALMKKWPLNSVFTASKPFYHLQQNLDGTSIQGRVLGCTRGGSGCQERGYIRGKKLYREWGIFSKRNRVRNRKMNSVLLDKTKVRHI